VKISEQPNEPVAKPKILVFAHTTEVSIDAIQTLYSHIPVCEPIPIDNLPKLFQGVK